MMRQGVLVQSHAHDLPNVNNPLPLLSAFPQWSRINAFEKSSRRKPFNKDLKLGHHFGHEHNTADDDLLAVTEMNPAQRIQYLERSIVFLKQEHAEMLHALHDEVEMLKKENKDLQFKLIMGVTPHSHQQSEDRKLNKEGKDEEMSVSSYSGLIEEKLKSEGFRRNDEMKILFLEEEVKELKRALRETRNKKQYLVQLLEKAEDQKKRQQETLDALKENRNSEEQTLPVALDQSKGETNFVGSLTTQPLTLQECQGLIKHLRHVNEQQGRELERLKLDLRDVLYSHKWTPDAFLMAKAYVAEDILQEEEKRKNLPRILMKTSTMKLPDIAYIRDNISLPALRQTMGNKVAERKRRTQVLQRSKLRPDVFLP